MRPCFNIEEKTFFSFIHLLRCQLFQQINLTQGVGTFSRMFRHPAKIMSVGGARWLSWASWHEICQLVYGKSQYFRYNHTSLASSLFLIVNIRCFVVISFELSHCSHDLFMYAQHPSVGLYLSHLKSLWDCKYIFLCSFPYNFPQCSQDLSMVYSAFVGRNISLSLQLTFLHVRKLSDRRINIT